MAQKKRPNRREQRKLKISHLVFALFGIMIILSMVLQMLY